MGMFTERLKKYLASSTPEQLERDYIELEEYNQVGPTPERYLLSLFFLTIISHETCSIFFREIQIQQIFV